MKTPKKKFTKAFKLEAVRMILERGMTKAEAGRRLEVDQTVRTGIE